MGDEISVTPSAIIGTLIGVFFIVAVVAFGSGIWLSFKPVIDEGSTNSFNVLTNYISSMIENKDIFVNNYPSKDSKQGPLPYYLVNGVILVGYNSEERTIHTDCSNEDAKRPAQLLGKAGLCLHVEDNANNFDEDPQEPIQCYAFEDEIIFLAPSDNNDEGGFGGSKRQLDVYGVTEEYEDLFLYGSECDSTYDLETTKLYIEKYSRNGKIYVYIEEYSEEKKDRIKERIDRIDKFIKSDIVKAL